MRLDDAWVEKLRKARPGRSQVLSVAHLAHTQQSYLREGDLLLSMNGTSTATLPTSTRPVVTAVLAYRRRCGGKGRPWR